MRWAVILAGGSGTRFWPLSTQREPKQFLSLAGGRPLLRQAVDRLPPLMPLEHVLIVTGEALAARTVQLLPELPRDNILAEPKAAGTAPALTWATYIARERDPDATILSLHADWFVGDDESFRNTASRALAAAETEDCLVAVGVTPTRPEVGYGYIEPEGEVVEGVARVARFREKPDATTAQELIEGGALWNSGMFAWTADRFFEETAAHAPEIAPFVGMLPQDVGQFYQQVTPVVIDISHFERSHRVVTVKGNFPWDDVGTWAALSRIRSTDAAGNVFVGEVNAIATDSCIVWAEDERVVLSGVNDLVVVRANGITLITTRERSVDLKQTLSELPPGIFD
ncbi:MAG: mannose-1-phosphate guanylyltransferase [Gemmatimonadales bacterium]